MPKSAARYEWIDVLRGVAVVGMVWTHCANTFLQSDRQATPFYHPLSFYHGLVAPTFFWLAGYMRGLSAAKGGARRPAWPTVKRLLIILGLGYLMHMPWGALVKWRFTTEDWRLLCQCDVLNCLAFACLALLGIEQVTAGTKVKAWPVVAALGLGVLLSTEAVSAITTGIMPVDALLSKRTGSLFPLFPWVAFACGGFVSGSFGAPGWRVLIVAAGLALVMPQFPHTGGTVGFFFERLGWVMLLAAVFCLLEPRTSKAPRWLRLAGRESLALYVSHLVIIYALPLWAGQVLSVGIGPTQPWWRVAVIFVLVLAASLGWAFFNERRKQGAARAG